MYGLTKTRCWYRSLYSKVVLSIKKELDVLAVTVNMTIDLIKVLVTIKHVCI